MTEERVSLQGEMAQLGQALHHGWVSEDHVVAASFAQLFTDSGNNKSVLQILCEHGRISREQHASLQQTTQLQIPRRRMGNRPTPEEFAHANRMIEQGMLSRARVQQIIRLQAYLAQLQIDRSLDALVDICKLVAPDEVKSASVPARPTRAKMVTQMQVARPKSKATIAMPAVPPLPSPAAVPRRNKSQPLIGAANRWPVMHWGVALLVLLAGLLVWAVQWAGGPFPDQDAGRVKHTLPLPPPALSPPAQLPPSVVAQKRQQAKVARQKQIITHEQSHSPVVEWQGRPVSTEQRQELLAQWGEHGRPQPSPARFSLNSVRHRMEQGLPYLSIDGQLDLPPLPKHMGVVLQLRLSHALPQGEPYVESEARLNEMHRLQADLLLPQPLGINLYALHISLLPTCQSEFVRDFFALRQNQSWCLLLRLGETDEITRAVGQRVRQLVQLMDGSSRWRQQIQPSLANGDQLAGLAREWGKRFHEWQAAGTPTHPLPLFPHTERLLAVYWQTASEGERNFYLAVANIHVVRQNLLAINRLLDIQYEGIQIALRREQQQWLRLLQEAKIWKITSGS